MLHEVGQNNTAVQQSPGEWKVWGVVSWLGQAQYIEIGRCGHHVGPPHRHILQLDMLVYVYCEGSGVVSCTWSMAFQ